MIHLPYSDGSETCSSMKQPNPDRLVVTLGIPITVHSPEHIRLHIMVNKCHIVQYMFIIINPYLCNINKLKEFNVSIRRRMPHIQCQRLIREQKHGL